MKPLQTHRRHYLLALAIATAATLASGFIDVEVLATFPDILDCESGCRTAAAGWPIPYVVDYPGLSPAGSASLIGALAGLDQFWPAHFAACLLCWLAASVVLVRGMIRLTDWRTSRMQR